MFLQRKGRFTPPKSITWKDAVKIIESLGAVYVRQKGDHKHYKRKTRDGTYLITIPVDNDICGELLSNIIRQTGVTKKVFWGAYFGFVPDSVKQEIFDST